MLKAGKMQEIADQVVGSQIQIVALQEVRWDEMGWDGMGWDGMGYDLLKKDKYSMYYSCNPNTTSHAGTRFLIQKATMSKVLIEPKIGNYQMGFRPNRSAIDNIFIVRQIYEKCYEFSIDLHNILLDFSYAFDTVNRGVIHNSLIRYNVPYKLIRLIKLTLQQTKMKVKINNNYTEWFETNVGLRQRDPLSALLFSLVLDTVITNLEI
jgi:hypothetical protein